MPSGEGIDHILGANMKSDVRECGLLWDMAHVQTEESVPEETLQKVEGAGLRVKKHTVRRSWQLPGVGKS